LSDGRLVVFAKAPRPGRVKTRLSPPLDPEQAAFLYDAMLQDVLETSARWAIELALEPVLAFHPIEGLREMLRRSPPAFQLHVQRGSDLGARMANAFAESVAAGVSFTLARGSDCPLLERGHLVQAIDALRGGADLVLTPDQGGGYVMIGARNPARALFEVPMSTEDVLGNTIDRAKALGLRCALTDEAPDVDRVEDLEVFEDIPPERSSDLCPRTVRFLGHLRAQGVL
jgi:rSAM/selenodomain-associated transferase 1